jgi:hypothetical protein
MVAGVLGLVFSTTLARSSVAPAVLRPALVGRRSLLRPRLVLACYDEAVVALRAAGLPVRLHCLLLQIGSVQELLELSLLLPQLFALQAG